MKDPMPVNLMTPAEIRESGWAAEARDDEGHLITTHAPFESGAERDEYVREETSRGLTVTIFPEK